MPPTIYQLSPLSYAEASHDIAALTEPAEIADIGRID